MIDKNKMPLVMGVAFVAFTTQFGGGFASGAQLYQYFINYGIWTLFVPIIAQFLLALFFWYGLRHAFINKTYDYRSFSDSFYGSVFGSLRPVFSNIYEIVYLMLICLAPAVAFATGGSTLNALTSIPYWVCTLIIGFFIFIVALYGTDLVRKCASTLSVLIIVGLVVVLVPNIIVQWGTIVESISHMAAGEVPVGSAESGSFMSALIKGLVYFLFQLASVGLMYQHVEPLTDVKQVDLAAIWMFIVNSVAIMLSVIGLLAIAFNPDLQGAPVPMLIFVQNGVGASILTPIISTLIVLGAVSTAVNMIAGIVTRTVNSLERRESAEEAKVKHRKRYFLAALGFTLLAFSIAQLGLIPLVNVGYSYLGYASFLALGIPFAIGMVLKRPGAGKVKDAV